MGRRGPKAVDPMLRFWKFVRFTDTCWLWTGSITAQGYGQFSISRCKSIVAHKFLYESSRGPVPRGLELDHKCRVRACVNPDHVEAVTHAENVRRGNSHSVVKARGGKLAEPRV